MTFLDSPVFSAHSERHKVSPFALIWRFVEMLRACSFAVAHRQFAFEYGPFESMRSIEWAFDGRLPISCKKSVKHRHSTLMPFPPYRCQSLLDGFWHLWSILRHKAYSSLFDSPCISLVAQPQLNESPYRRLLELTGFSFPHEHRQSQNVSLFIDGDVDITTQLPNT